MDFIGSRRKPVASRHRAWMVVALAGLGILFAIPATAAVLQARMAVDKSRAVFSITAANGVSAYERIVVKFHEGSDVRPTLSGLVAAAKNPAVMAELKAIEQRSRLEGLLLRKLFTRFDADRLAVLKRTIEDASGKELADLNLYFELPLPSGISPQKLARLLDFLNRQSSVEIAYATARPQPAALSVPSFATTPSFESMQAYRLPAPGGIDAVYAAGIPGGRGREVKIADVEGGWRLTHEDMPAVKSLSTGYNDALWANHGTAVIGVMGGRANGSGVTGLVADAAFSVAGIASISTAEAILKAGIEVGSGGVLLLELQQVGPADGSACSCNVQQCNSLPMEYWPAEFDAIKYVTAQGVTVVEAAGNGSVNLDDAVYNNSFNRQVRDSGAILVAASVSHARTPACFTNFGSRIDAHGWGDGVATLSYGDLSGTSEDNWYTASFSGTSSAAPIVAAAAASLQGVHLARRGNYLSPAAVRNLIKTTGTAQSGSLASAIGPLPNLKAAILTIAPASTGPVVISGSVLAGSTPGALTSISGPGASCSVSGATFSCTVANGWSGTLTPSRSGYVFTPASRSYVGVQANRTVQNFQIATLASRISISGIISHNGVPLANVQVLPSNVSGSASCTSSQIDGSYQCLVSSGWSGAISASAPGYIFVPASRASSNVTASQTAQNFATPVSAHTATIWYKRGFATPYIHYRPLGGNWTALPGVAMLNDSLYCGYSKYTMNLGSATSVEVAFNDGANGWDSNYGANYWFSEGNSSYAAGTTASGVPQASPCTQSVTFRVTATTVWGENIYLVGNTPQLGNWDASKAILMNSSAYPVWSTTLQMPVPAAFDYKYLRKSSTGVVTWEGGSNRTASISGAGPTVREDGSFRP